MHFVLKKNAHTNKEILIFLGYISFTTVQRFDLSWCHLYGEGFNMTTVGALYELPKAACT